MGVTHVLASSPLKPSPVVWFLAPAGGGSPSPKLGTGADVWRSGGGGERKGQRLKLLLPPGGLEWAEPWVVLGLSLYRKWELPALLGAGPQAKIKGGLLPGQWREIGVRLRTGLMSCWIVPASAARLLLGGELAIFCLGDWGAGSRGFVLLGGPFW